METKHTPGPWQWYNSIGGRILRNARIRAGQRQTVATVHLQRTGDEEHANARLIAAAPDLLEALQSLFEHCAMTHKRWGEGCNRRESDAAQDAARAAIAKATA